MVVLSTSIYKKPTYKDLPGGGFEYGGVTFDKSGKPTAIVNKEGINTYNRAVNQEQQIIDRQAKEQKNAQIVYGQEGTNGLYYELDPGVNPINNGRFKPIKDLTKDQVIEQVNKTGGNRIGGQDHLGDPITGIRGTSHLPENVEAGVMTVTPSEANRLQGNTNRPFWATLSTTPSEAVKEGFYMGNTNQLKSPFGKNTVGTYEFNYASIELGRMAYQGIEINDKTILQAQNLARQSRQGLGFIPNTKLLGASAGQSIAQFGLGVADLSANLLAQAGQYDAKNPIKWGQADISRKFKATRIIMNTPDAPNLSGFDWSNPGTYSKFGSYVLEIPNRPKIMTDIGLIGGTLYLAGSSTYNIYKAERVAGASRLSSLNVVGGEVLSSFSPYGKLQTGIIGYKTEVGKQTQLTPGDLTTFKVGQVPNIGEEVGKSFYTFEGGATYYTPKKITYGTVRTTLTSGSIPSIKTTSAISTQIVGVSGLGQATETSPSSSYGRGVKGTLNFDYEFYQVNRYTIGARPSNSAKGFTFKAFGKGISKGQFDLGTANVFYTDENNLLTKSPGLTIGKRELSFSNDNFRITTGKAGSYVFEESKTKTVKANTRLIEPLKGNDILGSGEGEGGSYSGGRGGGRALIEGQKNIVDIGKTTLEPTTLREIGLNLPKTGTALGGGLGLGLGLGLGGGQASKGSQRLISLPYTETITSPSVIQIPKINQKISPIQKITPLQIPKLTSPLSPLLTPTLTVPLTPGFGNDVPFNPGLLTPGIPLLSGGDFGNLKFGKVPPINTPKGYTPSFTALFFKIKGKRSKGPYTGYEFRPIEGNRIVHIKKVRRVKR